MSEHKSGVRETGRLLAVISDLTDALVDRKNSEAMPGAQELVKAIQEQGVTFSVATDVDIREADRTLIREGLSAREDPVAIFDKNVATKVPEDAIDMLTQGKVNTQGKGVVAVFDDKPELWDNVAAFVSGKDAAGNVALEVLEPTEENFRAVTDRIIAQGKEA